MPRRDGIDVASYQHLVDWPQVAALGVWWAACKATEGGGYLDPTFAQNRSGMAAASIPLRGLYHWLRPDVAPLAQAQHYLRTVGTLAVGEFVLLDAEQAGVTADMTRQWCELVEAQTARPVVIYTGVYIDAGGIAHLAQGSSRPLVIAAYISEQGLGQALSHAALAWPSGWQWSGGASVPGVPGACDVDQIDDRPAMERAAGLPTQEDDMTPAQEAKLDALAAAVADLRTLLVPVFQQITTPGPNDVMPRSTWYVAASASSADAQAIADAVTADLAKKLGS